MLTTLFDIITDTIPVRCLDNLAEFVQPFLDVISEMTGGVCGLWTAAPEPRNGGEPTILTYAAVFLYF